MKTVFFDVDTQLDFLYPAGALYVRGAEQLSPGLSELTRLAAAHRIQILSTVDAHVEDDPEFRVWKPHCVRGTIGQSKTALTLLPNHTVLTTAVNGLEQISDVVGSTPQIIVEKQQLDAFTNPNLTPLLKVVRADRFVVYGVVTEYCVGIAALGLLKTGAQVELVEDAIRSLSSEDERDLIERFRAQGGKLTRVREVVSELASEQR